MLRKERTNHPAITGYGKVSANPMEDGDEADIEIRRIISKYQGSGPQKKPQLEPFMRDVYALIQNMYKLSASVAALDEQDAREERVARAGAEQAKDQLATPREIKSRNMKKANKSPHAPISKRLDPRIGYDNSDNKSGPVSVSQPNKSHYIMLTPSDGGKTVKIAGR